MRSPTIHAQPRTVATIENDGTGCPAVYLHRVDSAGRHIHYLSHHEIAAYLTGKGITVDPQAGKEAVKW